MATEHQLEVLSDAYQALLRSGDFMTCADPRSHIRISNILLDACLDAGMPHDEPIAREWAAVRLFDWLAQAVCDCGADLDAGGEYCHACLAEYRAEALVGCDA